MINSFLATLHNSVVPPTPVSSTGSVLWPSPYTPKVYTGAASLANGVLFQAATDANSHFLVAIQLLWLVSESVLADRIIEDDTRITYNQAQLLGQFESYALSDPVRAAVSEILTTFDSIQGTQFLTGELLDVYRSALSRLDRLAAVVVYFGQRND